jgi:hypothetical protein
MTTQAIFDAAVLGNDPFPDDVCPACHQDITGWSESEFYRCHYRADHRPSYSQAKRLLAEKSLSHYRYPFIPAPHGPGVCSWTSDDLAARAHIRRLIEEGVTS